MSLLLLACAIDPVLDTGLAFHIVGSSPEDGEENVIEAVLPEVRFSEPVSQEACGSGAVRLDAVDENGAVLFAVETTATFSSVDEKIQLEHDIPLHHGYDYALTVRGATSETDQGCTSLSGEVVAPFFARFRVP